MPGLPRHGWLIGCFLLGAVLPAVAQETLEPIRPSSVWEGTTDSGEFIRFTLYPDSTATLMRSRSGRTRTGEVVAGILGVAYRVREDDQAVLDLDIGGSPPFVPAIAAFDDPETLRIGWPVESLRRPDGFGPEQVRVIWVLKKVE